MPAQFIALGKNMLERAIAGEQFVGAFAAQGDAETILMNPARDQIGVEAGADDRRLEGFDALRPRSRAGTGFRGFAPRTPLRADRAWSDRHRLWHSGIGRIAAGDDIGGHLGPVAARIMRHQGAVDPAAEERGEGQVGGNADAHRVGENLIQGLRRSRLKEFRRRADGRIAGRNCGSEDSRAAAASLRRPGPRPASGCISEQKRKLCPDWIR